MISESQSTKPYVVLARKWRPAQFSDIVGQGPIVRTLMNAIRGERIHQAYLFTGSRGIGKTSIARIFAKVIRCESRIQTETELRSCDQCTSCKEIALGQGMDVIEIDGASNNGVEAVREIRENAKYMPASGARKIYIIDEVHMLTTAAFNALLKTLEEPPPHVIFIFATTEPHKIPATILSRCQRFDFRRVSGAQIQGRLSEISQAEGITAEASALALLARAAEGSMRDSLSLLDQVIAFSEGRVTINAVRESIGLVEGETLLGILDAVFSRKPVDALDLVNEAYQRGHDLRVLTRSLIEFLHGAIIAKIGGKSAVTGELSVDEQTQLATIAGKRSLEEIELFFQVLHHGLDWIARSPQPKIVLDLLLVKCATAEALVSVSAPEVSGTAPAPRPTPDATSVRASVATPPVKTAPIATTPVEPTSSTPAGASASPPAAPITPSSFRPRNWEGLIEHVRSTRPLLASILEHGSCDAMPAAIEGQNSELVIYFNPKDAYFRDQLQSRVYVEQLATLAKDYFGFGIRVTLELKDSGESLAAKREREVREKRDAARSAAQNHPVLREARALFGGELAPIEIIDNEEMRAD